MVVSNEEENIEEERFPFCMKCRDEIEKQGKRFCPDCRGLVLFYTRKQISTFKNQKAKKVDKDLGPAKTKTTTKTPRILSLLEGEEEFNPALPYPQTKSQ